MKSKNYTKTLLKPGVFLKIIMGTLAICVLSMGLLVIITQPYQQNQDLRRQADTTGLGCNQLCTTSDDCAINLRCYNIGVESRCRLALNPISSTCQETNPDDGQDNQYGDSAGTTKGGLNLQDPLFTPEPEVTDLPLASPTPFTDSDSQTDGLETPPAQDDQIPPSDQDVVDQNSVFTQLKTWWQSFNSTEQANTKRMLTVIFSVGLILVGLAIILSSTKSSAQTPPVVKTTTASATDHKVTTHPKSETSTPPPSTLTASSISSSSSSPPKHSNTNQPVPTTVSSAQLYPSGGMTARLKQKGVTPPK